MPILEPDCLRADTAGADADGDDEEGDNRKDLDSGADQPDIIGKPTAMGNWHTKRAKTPPRHTPIHQDSIRRGRRTRRSESSPKVVFCRSSNR